MKYRNVSWNDLKQRKTAQARLHVYDKEVAPEAIIQSTDSSVQEERMSPSAVHQPSSAASSPHMDMSSLAQALSGKLHLCHSLIEGGFLQLTSYTTWRNM